MKCWALLGEIVPVFLLFWTLIWSTVVFSTGNVQEFWIMLALVSWHSAIWKPFLPYWPGPTVGLCLSLDITVHMNLWPYVLTVRSRESKGLYNSLRHLFIHASGSPVVVQAELDNNTSDNLSERLRMSTQELLVAPVAVCIHSIGPWTQPTTSFTWLP